MKNLGGGAKTAQKKMNDLWCWESNSASKGAKYGRGHGGDALWLTSKSPSAKQKKRGDCRKRTGVGTYALLIILLHRALLMRKGGEKKETFVEQRVEKKNGFNY